MGVLIKNEFYKLKREWFMVFLLLLSLLPIITGGAGAIFNSSTKSLADLFFFMNNQFVLPNGALHFDWFAVLSGIQKQNLHQLDYLRIFKEEALSIESYCQRRYRHLLCGCLIYRIWPIGGDTQWSWQVDRRYFPVPQAGNRVWN